MAPFDFDFNGFAPDGGGDVGGAFGHVQQILDGVKFTVRFTVITVNVQTL